MAARGSIQSALRVLTLCLLYCNFYSAFRFKLTNVGCESYNKSWVYYKECRLRAVSRNKTTLTAFVIVTEPAYDIFVHVQVLKRANGYKPWLMDYTIDACKFMRHRHHPMGKMLWNFIKDVSTINHSCPYVGYNGLRDFYNIDNIPIIPPTGEYLLNLTWIFDKRPQFVTKVYFSFQED